MMITRGNMISLSKKTYVPLAMLLVSLSLPGMSTLPSESVPQIPTITRPYTPSWNAKYPVLWGLIKTGLCMTAAYYVGSYQEIVPAYVIAAGGLVAGGTASVISYSRNKYRFLNYLLLNPIAALNTMYKTRKIFMKELEKEKLDTNEDQRRNLLGMQKLATLYAKVCPLFLLGECVREDWWHCALSRRFEPDYRNFFEQKVVKALVGCLQNHTEKPVQYVGFGSGGGFQDLVIAVKALAQKPDSSLSIHLIDKNFVCYVKCAELDSNSHEIILDNSLDYHSVMPQAKELYTSENNDPHFSEDKFENALIATCNGYAMYAKQFLSYLQKTFPRAHVSLYLHYEKQDYLDYIEKHQIDYPDVVAAADIQDEMSLMAQGPLHYASLCFNVLKQKPESQNFLLSRGGGIGKIGKITLTEHENSSKEEIFDEVIYSSFEKINASTSALKKRVIAMKYPYVS